MYAQHVTCFLRNQWKSYIAQFANECSRARVITAESRFYNSVPFIIISPRSSGAAFKEGAKWGLLVRRGKFLGIQRGCSFLRYNEFHRAVYNKGNSVQFNRQRFLFHSLLREVLKKVLYTHLFILAKFSRLSLKKKKKNLVTTTQGGKIEKH